MLFDFDHVPFSRYGRFLTLSMMRRPDSQERALYFRSVRGGDERPSLGQICEVQILNANGHDADVEWTLSPSRLDGAVDGGGSVSFAIGDGESLCIRGQNCQVLFLLQGSRYDYATRLPDGRPCVISAAQYIKFIPSAQLGNLNVDGAWRVDHSDDVTVTFSGARFEGRLDCFERVPPGHSTEGFDDAETGARAGFEAWLYEVPAGHPGQDEAQRLAAYLLWANTVPPFGLLGHPTIYMSKNAMINIWSWDNAFSALGVAAMSRDLAFAQFAAIYDHQDASGLLPDFVNDRDAAFSFTKPPIHGWAIGLINAAHPDFLTMERKLYLRRALARQTEYWLTYARASENELPAYLHGNDSGWDNASFFLAGGPLISPDLTTFLILCAEQLTELYAGEPQAVRRWTDVADRLYALLVEQLWTGETFIARLVNEPARVLPGQSLIQFMPLLLGARLAAPIRKALLERLKAGAFITDWGPATESTQSSLYVSDGYWRGPIWAPTTYLLWDALRRQGETGLAREIAEKFCALANLEGMAENFDAETGRGLRDRAFAWTSAVYILLAAWLNTSRAGED